MNIKLHDRILIGCVFTVAAVFLCLIGLYGPWRDNGPDYGGLLLNAGSELLGVVVTVLIIDVLNERRERKEEVKRLSWEFLHEIDAAVWTWLGGRRSFDLGELLGFLRNVNELDPLPSFVRNQVRDIGSRAAQYLRLRQELINTSKTFGDACEHLRPLAGIQDTPWQPPYQNDLANVLGRAVRSLCETVETTLPDPGTIIDTEWQKDTRFTSQQWRFYGRVQWDRDFDATQD